MTTYRICCCFRRKFRSSPDEAPPTIKLLFQQYSDGGVMGPEQLRKFLVEVQRDDPATATTDKAQGIIEAYFRTKHHLNVPFYRKAGLTLNDFLRYLFDDANSPLISSGAIPGEVYHDMTAPMSHYFIYTGHNSYLTGNQLSSDCSDVPIIRALRDGVRVIELDMWPNSSGTKVNINHGRTITTPVEMLRCLNSIRENAFVKSPYPVIITLEDHLTPELQDKAARMIHEVFGDMLFVPHSESASRFPSPEELKWKIIISTKPPREYLEAKDSTLNKEEEQDGHSTDREEDEAAAAATATKANLDQGGDQTSYGQEEPKNSRNWVTIDIKKHHSEEIQDDNEDDQSYCEEEHSKAHQESIGPIAPSYKRLIAIPARKASGRLSRALFEVDPNKVTRLSLSEQVLEKAIHSYSPDILRFTRTNLLRIYPKGARITSSNYNPFKAWAHGAQLVAFNMQGHGKYLWMMQGMFRANGGCGYVKKPDILLRDSAFYPRHADKLKVRTLLKVRVYMGDGWRFDFPRTYFDTCSPPDFYAKVGIVGVDADKAMKKTKAVNDNWTPVWDEEEFVFRLRVPELALLRIEVRDEDVTDEGDFAGQTCLPLSELKPGIRAVPLCDQKGVQYKSVKLLMRFDFIQN